MIISASRRTDIPDYYADWLINRIRSGFVDVRNPMFPNQVNRISLSPDVIDAFVFWTKNPQPMMKYIDEIAEKYPFYFQFTITPYGKDIERNIPEKNAVIQTFMQLSEKVGRERVIWRYDPIFFNEKYTKEFHIEKFSEMAQQLAPFTEKCVISILDQYNKHLPYTIGDYDVYRVVKHIGITAADLGIKVESCSEAIDFSQFGIGYGHCIDKELIERICGYPLDVQKDKNQRSVCGCMMSVDIGQYNTCRNSCNYCYATGRSQNNAISHDPESSLIVGQITSNDVLKERKIKSFRMIQNKLF